MSTSTTSTQAAPAELFIWTDIDPSYETEFNRWYDQEHMAERAGIPGFLWARRYRAQSGPRPYLALYRTQSLGTFYSEPYRRAFNDQTAWSREAFGKMRNTTRRVTSVSPLLGAGAGSAIALLEMGSSDVSRAADGGGPLQAALSGALAARVLVPDEALSTPLPVADANNKIEPYLVIDAISKESAAEIGGAAAAALGIESQHLTIFSLIWELRAADLPSSNF